MTDTDIDPHRRRLKRIRFRAWHRGTREMDLLLGGFADARLESLDDAQLERFEALLEVPDDLLYTWVSDKVSPDAAHDNEVFAMVKAHKLDPVNGQI